LRSFALVLALGAPQEAAPVYPEPPPGAPPLVANAAALAATEAEMQRYVEAIPGSAVSFAMVPIRGGRFRMGSPEGEKGRKADEGPLHEVELAPFWIGEHEVTWDEYRLFQAKLDLELRKSGAYEASENDRWADAVSRPTPPYVPMDFGMGFDGYPAISMTQLAAKQYTKWLSMKTGRFYRLPTEAEWEYAARAGTSTAYSFGDDAGELGEHAWYFDNSGDRYHPVGKKKPNPWGLYDVHGNVAEWVLDELDPGFYSRCGERCTDPIRWPQVLDPRVVRGGSWDDDPERLRSAARRGSSPGWKVQDPQLPKSIWYLTDAKFVGFRVVRPLAEPPDEVKSRSWEPDLDAMREVLERQRRGAR
jgi:formylglycine-generating enzyme required for sulfatase activity